jgi:hypothetical protein
LWEHTARKEKEKEKGNPIIGLSLLRKHSKTSKKKGDPFPSTARRYASSPVSI